MNNEPINFLDFASGRQRMRFAATLQLNTERALWALEDAARDTGRADRSIHLIRDLMQELHNLSMACGYTRVAAICGTICSLIETTAANLLQGILAQVIALRAIVTTAMQDEAAAIQRLA